MLPKPQKQPRKRTETRKGYRLHKCGCGSAEFAQDGSKIITNLRKAYCVKCGEPLLHDTDGLIDLPKLN